MPAGGEAPTGPNAGKKADFAVKKSVLLSRFHEFDKVPQRARAPAVCLISPYSAAVLSACVAM